LADRIIDNGARGKALVEVIQGAARKGEALEASRAADAGATLMRNIPTRYEIYSVLLVEFLNALADGGFWEAADRFAQAMGGGSFTDSIRGFRLVSEGNLDQAWQLAERTSTYHVWDHEDIYSRLAVAFMQRGNSDRARAALERVVTLRDKTLLGMTTALVAQGRYQEGWSYAVQVFNPHERDAVLKSIAMTFIRLSRTKEATDLAGVAESASIKVEWLCDLAGALLSK